MNSLNAAFKALPSVDKALQSEALSPLVVKYGHEAVKAAIRSKLDEVRNEISAGDSSLVDAIL